MKFLQYNRRSNLLYRRVILLMSVLFFCSTSGYSQITLDSIEKIRETIKSPAKRLHMEMYLAEEYMDVNLKKSDEYFNIVAEKLDTIKPIYVLRYYLAKSIRERIEGNPDLGIENAYMAMEVANTYKDSARYKAKIYNSLGSLYDDKSDIPKSIENHLIGLRYAESIDYKAQIATICNGVGRAYLYLPNYEKAKEYYGRAAQIKESLGQFDISLASSYGNLSICYKHEKDYGKSLLYLNKAIKIREEYENNIHLISTYNNKASTLLLMNRINEADAAVKYSLKLADSFNVDNEKMFTLGTYASVLIAQNNIDKAENVLNQSISLSKKRNDLHLIKDNLERMFDLNFKKKNYKSALEFYKQRTIIMDAINSIDSKKLTEQLVLDYETEKKDAEIALLDSNAKLSKIELKKSRQLQYTLLAIALLLLAVLGLLWSRHKNKIKTDKLLKEAMEQSFEKKLADSELQALRAQMNPHFLFNCLNSINGFIIKNDQEQASEYLSKFSKLIRLVLNNSKSSVVLLENELEALKLYIEMESLRFNNKFKYSINVDPAIEVDYIEVPPLIIQPYVENSIWHGLMNKKQNDGLLTINLTQDQSYLIISVEDNGVGREAAAKLKSKDVRNQKSFGMNITKDRLKYINFNFNEKTDLQVIDLKNNDQNPIGTKVIVKIAI